MEVRDNRHFLFTVQQCCTKLIIGAMYIMVYKTYMYFENKNILIEKKYLKSSTDK